jgi:AraC-like DNA-binding protein
LQGLDSLRVALRLGCVLHRLTIFCKVVSQQKASERCTGMSKVTSLATSDPDECARTRAPGWVQRIWKLRPGPFLSRSHRVELAPGLLAERIALSGGVRISGTLAEGHLHIGFYDAPTSRLMGAPIGGYAMAITLGGAYWEGSSLGDITGWNLQVGPEFSTEILPAGDVQAFFEDRANRPMGRMGLWLSAPDAGRALLERLRHLTSLPESSAELDAPQLVQAVVRDAQAALRDARDALVDESPSTSARRIEIAQHVERALWAAAAELAKSSIPDVQQHLCAQLGVSVRTLQLAVSEQFGVGFHQLVRAIRLHQARRRLYEAAGSVSVTDAALAHGFTHLGRFSTYYRNMFGELPSDARRGGRRGTP